MRRKTLFVSVLVLLMLSAAVSLAAKAVETTNVPMARADPRAEGPQPQALVWGNQKKWAYQYWYAYGQAYNSATWPNQGILFSSGFQVDSYAYYSFTLPVPPSGISYLDVGIYGKALSGNGLDVHVWNWASSSWDFVHTTPTAEGHNYWGVSPTNHVQGSSYEYRLRVYADDYSGNDDRYDMWYIDTYYQYTQPTYSVTIWSFLMNEGWISGVPITMDGVPTGYTTAHTFTGLTGTHTFTVPSYYAPYTASFTDWNPGGSTSTTITVTSGGTWTARYTRTYSVTISAYCYTETAYISRPITKDGSPSGYNTPHTFTGLVGSHTFTVPGTDAMGHPFIKWLSGSTSTTITVSSAGTYYALYQATAAQPTVEIWTNKATYAKGEALTAYIQGFNSGPAPVAIRVNCWFGLPGGGTYMLETFYEGTIPASYTSPVYVWKSVTIPYSAAVGTYSVNAEMRNPTTNALIDSDTYYFTIT